MNDRLSLAIAMAAAVAVSGCSLTGPRWFERTSIESPIDVDLAEQMSSELKQPQGLVATSGELRAIPLKWEPVLVGAVGGYAIERSGQADGPFKRLATVHGQLNTRYVDREIRPESGGSGDPGPVETIASTNLDDGSTWFYRVRAMTPAGTIASAPSEVESATTALPPEPPADLRAYSRQPRKVPLSWRPSEDRLVEGYRIYRSPTRAGPYQQIAELDGRFETTFVDAGLGDLRVFYYQVAAINSLGGLGEPTRPVRAVTKPEPLPPLNLRAAEQRLGSNLISWEPNVEPDIVRYRLLRTRESGETSEIIVPAAETWFEDRSVGAGEPVSYSIVAVDADGLESNPAMPVAIVSVGYGLEATPAENRVLLQWDAETAAPFRGGYVYRHEGFGRRNLGFTTESQFVDPEVQAGARYRYTVVLERPDASLAPPSQPVEVEIPPSVGAR